MNAAGQRFLNEDVYFGRAGETVLLHQGGRAHLVIDDEYFARPEAFPVEVAAAATIAELEAELAIPTGALQQTVAYYNEHAARGEDPLFHKGAGYLTPIAKPPFGAIDLSSDAPIYTAFTLGGLHIDAHGRVLAAAGGDPVPGLYAAGRTTSGISKQGYSSGMSLGDGSFFGRAAGRHASARRA